MMSFAQVMGGIEAKENSSRGRGINPNIICHRCEETGHIAQNCTKSILVNHAQYEENNEKVVMC